MSEIKNGRLDLYGTKYSKCHRTMTLGFKGLITLTCICMGQKVRRNAVKQSSATYQLEP